MVLPKTAGEAKRGYVRTSGITRGDAKPKPAVQSSNLERFGFWTKPCESAAATTPAESQSTKPHVEASEEMAGWTRIVELGGMFGYPRAFRSDNARTFDNHLVQALMCTVGGISA